MFTPWLGTGHATMFTEGINGGNGTHYTGACISCHTVGYDPGVSNGGFDDVAATAGWSFPATLAPGNWDAMVTAAPAVAQLANVQCENCHGPQTSNAHTQTRDANGVSQPFQSPRISYSAEACATCHAAGGAPHLLRLVDGRCRDRDGALEPGRCDTVGSSAAGLNSSCGRCHVAQGYTLYAGLLQQGKVAIDVGPGRDARRGHVGRTPSR